MTYAGQDEKEYSSERDIGAKAGKVFEMSYVAGNAYTCPGLRYSWWAPLAL